MGLTLRYQLRNCLPLVHFHATRRILNHASLLLPHARGFVPVVKRCASEFKRGLFCQLWFHRRLRYGVHQHGIKDLVTRSASIGHFSAAKQAEPGLVVMAMGGDDAG